MTANWKFLVYGGANIVPNTWTAQAELTSARGKTLKVRLNDSDEITFTLNGEHSDAALIHELVTDIVATRNDTLVSRCRVGQTTDTIDDAVASLTVNARSYQEILKRRFINAGEAVLAEASTTPIEQEQIGWDLISAGQLILALFPWSRNLGITRGTSQTTGITRNVTYTAWSYITDNINNTLVNVTNGFDWIITPDLIYKVYYPQRGTVHTNDGVYLSYPGNLKGFSVNFDPNSYTNFETVQGVNNTITSAISTSAVSNNTEPAGSWDRFIGMPDYILAAQTTAQVNYDLNRNIQKIPAYSLTMSKNAWGGPSSLWVGDTCLVSLTKGRVQVQANMRIIGLDIEIDDEGNEGVKIYVANPDRLLLLKQQNKDILSRLSNLERR